jgi:hypothetical protein
MATAAVCPVCGKEFQAGETIVAKEVDGLPAMVHPLCSYGLRNASILKEEE